MQPPKFKRTKIIATIGPACSSLGGIEALMGAGVNGFRLNFAHGTHQEYTEIISRARRTSAKLNKPVAIIQDLQGPKIRVGDLPGQGIQLSRGQVVSLKFGANYNRTNTIPIQYDFSPWVKPGSDIFLRDGLIKLAIEKVERRRIEGRVLTPGILFSNQGINLPDAKLGGEILTKKDMADVDFAVKGDVDYIALSFVQTARDIERLKRRLAKLGSDIAVIAKIETKAAVDNLEAIVMASDGVMVARGDLAVETMPEAVPVLQARIIELARRHHKLVIVATQMLDSMIKVPQPTRAEVADVAAAVTQRTDCVMLSSETAVGDFPIEAVRMMKRIIRYTETYGGGELKIDFGDPSTRQNAISAAAIILARQMGAKGIIAETTTGQTARNLASYRPPVHIITATHKRRVYQQMSIIWGGNAYLLDSMVNAGDKIVRQLKKVKYVKAGDALVMAAGRQPGVAGGTDTVHIKMVK